MSFLDDISLDQRQLLVSLPYRVGLRVSQCDVSGGADSDVQELQALSNILGGIAGEVFVSETVQYVISETVEQQDYWPEWAADLGDVEDDCRRAVNILSGFVDEKEVSAFKQHLMEVGEAVALAFRENEAVSFFERLKLKMLYMKLNYKAKKEGWVYKSFDAFLNVSRSERAVLSGLARALDIKYIV